jgi:nitrous oxide reductase accessory protein NosL
MGANAAGFSSKEAAQKGLAGKQGTILSWNELFEQIN